MDFNIEQEIVYQRLLISARIDEIDFNDEIERRLEEGDEEALCELGRRYFNRRRSLSCMKKAYDWFQLGKAKQNGEAYYYCGLIAKEGYVKQTNVYKRDIFVDFYEAAERGVVAACFEVGQCHEKGIGTPIDIVKAREWYQNGLEELPGQVHDKRCRYALLALQRRDPRANRGDDEANQNQ